MKRLLCVVLLTITSLAAHAATGGVGDLLVTPTRIVLDRRTRTAEVALINTGTQPATYRVELQHLRMRESGELVPAPADDAAFPDTLVQFSPRRVTLEPHIAQTVRLRLRMPAAAGESYVHLLFHGEPPVETEAAPADPRGLSIRVTPVYGVSIPIIVRGDEASARVNIASVRLAAAASLALDLTRSGNGSTFGDIAVAFKPHGGRASQIALAKGVSVYAPLESRSMTLALQLPNGVALRDGTLQVSYVDAERAGAAAPVVATLDLP